VGKLLLFFTGLLAPVEDSRIVEKTFFRILLNRAPVDAEFDADFEFYIEILKKWKFNGEKSDLP
jgi:hypothetical protein